MWVVVERGVVGGGGLKTHPLLAFASERGGWLWVVFERGMVGWVVVRKPHPLLVFVSERGG